MATPWATRRDFSTVMSCQECFGQKTPSADYLVMPLNIPDLLSSNLDLAETGAKGKAGGVQRLPLLL